MSRESKMLFGKNMMIGFFINFCILLILVLLVFFLKKRMIDFHVLL